MISLALLGMHSLADPISPSLLAGNYSLDSHEVVALQVAGTDPQPGELRKVSVTRLIAGGSCWASANGTVSDDGRIIDITALPAPNCKGITPHGTGHVIGDLPAQLKISWHCVKPQQHNATCKWPDWTQRRPPLPTPPATPTPPPPPPAPGAWPNICTNNSKGLESCWPTCQVRCPANAACCKTPYSVQGQGCCSNAPNPDKEPGCKAGPPLPLATNRTNVVIMGDSVSMGYTPWVQKHLGEAGYLVQHSVWGDGSAICNTTTDPPCDPDPSGASQKRMLCSAFLNPVSPRLSLTCRRLHRRWR